MAYSKQFTRKLDDLWRRRTANLRSLVRTRRGPNRQFNKKIRDRAIEELQELATKILIRQGARKELGRLVVARRRWQIKGWGIADRSARLVGWAEGLPRGPVIYSFWRRKRCLYVGKGMSWERLRDYNKSIYLNQATSLRVCTIGYASQLAKAECLATHLFSPRDRKVKPASQKWGKKCPICKAHDQIRDELRAIFRLR